MQKLTIIGNLGEDARVVQPAQGSDRQPFVAFPVACNESWKDAQGVKQERTTWYNCISSYQNIAAYLKKGNQIYVEGQPIYKTFTDKAGNQQIDITIRVNNFEFIGGKKAE